MNDQLESPDTVETIEPLKLRSETGTAISSNGSSNVVAEARSARTQPRTQPAAPPRRRTAFQDNEDDDEDNSFFGRHKIKLATAVVVIVSCLTTYLIKSSGDTKPRKAPERMVMIQIPPPAPPPPPPPPPPKVEPPKVEEKMIEQAPVEDEEPKPADEPPAISTGIKGDGPGMKGLSSKSGPLGGGTGLGKGRGGPFDGFARSASSRVKGAISTHAKTRSARIPSCELRVWVDSTGRVIRAKLNSSSGDSATDAAIQNEVLPGLQLDPPPPGMPMPIVMRLSARRPT